MMLVYFDNCILAYLNGGNPKYDSKRILEKIEKAKVGNRIDIIISMEVIEELMGRFESNREEYSERWALMHRLADWSRVPKYHCDLLEDDIVSFAQKGKPDSPFVRLGQCNYSLVQKLAGMAEAPCDSMAEKVCQGLEKSGTGLDFLKLGKMDDLVQEWREDQKKEGAQGIEEQWKSVWKTEPNLVQRNAVQHMAGGWADYFSVGRECRERGLDKLVELPTVRVAVGYIFYKWKAGLPEKGPQKVKRNDYYDFRHAIHAGAIGTLVTDDKKLTEAMKQIPGHSIQVYTLEEWDSM